MLDKAEETMCRLLAVKSEKAFSISEHLRPFAVTAKRSREYQGHGWGCVYLSGGTWRVYRNIQPIWEDDLSQFGETTLLVAHARSAFRDEGICVENNMPFLQGDIVFSFNGELHGVRIREEGCIGAEKLFRFILRFHKEGLSGAVRKAIPIVEKRTRSIRAMNMIVADPHQVVVSTLFTDDPDYFTLHRCETSGIVIVASDPYPDESGWTSIPNRTQEVIV